MKSLLNSLIAVVLGGPHFLHSLHVRGGAELVVQRVLGLCGVLRPRQNNGLVFIIATLRVVLLLSVVPILVLLRKHVSSCVV